MAQLIVRNLDESVKSKLQLLARKHGRSTEEEVRNILRNVVRKGDNASSRPLGTLFKTRFARIGLKNDIPELRGQLARPADLSK